MYPTNSVDINTKIEESLAKKSEGYVFVQVALNFFGNEWSMMREYFVVLKGIIYCFEKDGKMHESGGTFFDLTRQSLRVGRFNPKYKYQFSSRQYTYKQIKRLL